MEASEHAPDTALDLCPAFQDPDHTPDSSLTYVAAANFNPGLFSEGTLSDGRYLELGWAPDGNGAADLTLQATDPGGLWVTTTLQVTVNPVNDIPDVEAGTSQNGEEGEPLTLSGAFPDLEVEPGEAVTVTGVLTDPGYLDTHSVEITWADGQTTTLALGAGERQFSAPHTYGKVGEYAVAVKGSDDDGSWDQNVWMLTDGTTCVGSCSRQSTRKALIARFSAEAAIVSLTEGDFGCIISSSSDLHCRQIAR